MVSNVTPSHACARCQVGQARLSSPIQWHPVGNSGICAVSSPECRIGCAEGSDPDNFSHPSCFALERRSARATVARRDTASGVNGAAAQLGQQQPRIWRSGTES
ncbi:hypothetical protein L1887_59202 [Cichorium endivia]|nr:hypothetical protein L1887_59202 [Cichorium endivia]